MDYRHLDVHDGELCWSFYNDIYRPAFPKRDYAGHPALWLPLMEDRPPQPKVHIILASEFDTILGGAVVEWYRATASWLLTALAVKPEVRRCGVATGLLAQVAGTVQAHGAFQLLFAETEHPDHLADVQRDAVRERLRVLTRLGMRQLPVRYVQPARCNRAGADALLLIHRQMHVPATRVRAFLTEFYAASQQVEAPGLVAMNARLAMAAVVQSQVPL